MPKKRAGCQQGAPEVRVKLKNERGREICWYQVRIGNERHKLAEMAKVADDGHFLPPEMRPRGSRSPVLVTRAAVAEGNSLDVPLRRDAPSAARSASSGGTPRQLLFSASLFSPEKSEAGKPPGQIVLA